MINLGLRLSGYSGVLWGKIDGAKTYIVGLAAVLTGLLGMLQNIQPVIEQHDLAALIAFLKALPHDQSWLTVMGGLGTMGLRHGITKSGPTKL